MRTRIIATLATLATILGLTVATAPQASAWTQNYKGPYLCTWDGGKSWMQITSWNINSTQRRYHISYREDLATTGSSFRHINNGSIRVRTNSAYDSNPQDFYWTVYGHGSRTFTAYWWDVILNLPAVSRSCSITQ